MENLILNSGWEALFRMNHPELFHNTSAQGVVLNTTTIVVEASSPTVVNAGTKNSGNVFLHFLFMVGVGWVIYEIIKASIHKRQKRY